MPSLPLCGQNEKDQQEKVKQKAFTLQSGIMLGRPGVMLLCLMFFTSGVIYSDNISADTNPTPDELQTENKSKTTNTRRIQTADAKQLGVGQDIGFVEQLVNQSAAAKQIIESDNPEAKALREQAINHLEDAKQQQAIGNNDAAAQLLGKAKIVIFQAVRLSGSKVVKDKHTANYKKRVQSVNVLLDAHQRISDEKGDIPAAREVERHVRAELQKAQKKFEEGKVDQALEIANIAYLSIKLQVTRLRDGDTLVRELNFKTKEDEYKYEIERNNTHKVLVNVVLKEKISPQMSMLIKTPMKKAEELRQQAIQQADGKDFEKAIHTLEESTQQIIRAIRMAGIYIPG